MEVVYSTVNMQRMPVLYALPALCIKRTNNLVYKSGRVNPYWGMAQSIVVHGLIKKRAEIAGLHKAAQKAADTIKDDLAAIDRALALCGYQDDAKALPRVANTSSYSGAMS